MISQRKENRKKNRQGGTSHYLWLWAQPTSQMRQIFLVKYNHENIFWCFMFSYLCKSVLTTDHRSHLMRNLWAVWYVSVWCSLPQGGKVHSFTQPVLHRVCVREMPVSLGKEQRRQGLPGEQQQGQCWWEFTLHHPWAAWGIHIAISPSVALIKKACCLQSWSVYTFMLVIQVRGCN